MILHEATQRIQDAMRAAFPLPDIFVARFYAMQHYHLGWRDEYLQPAALDPGKLLRPRLALLACSLVGGNAEQALPLAAGIQLIHDFSLIHDDIEDHSETRRGRATVWRQWGMEQGINVGDGMFVIAHLSLHRLVDVGVAAPTVLTVLRRFDETILLICEGQFLDLSFEGDPSIRAEQYLAMIERKTAVLIAAATELGGLVGGAPPPTSDRLFEFGKHLGIAFQIQDDILGIWGEPLVTGKPYAADIHRRKVSLPIVIALQHASDQDRQSLERFYGQESLTDEDVARVLAILDATDARRRSEEHAVNHHQTAMVAFDHVQPSDSLEASMAAAQLRALVETLPGRVT